MISALLSLSAFVWNVWSTFIYPTAAVERGWLWMQESGTYVNITPAGAALLA
jgi:hypothetical protein